MSTDPAIDERQPLLPPAALASDVEVPGHDEENPVVAQQLQESPKQKRSWWTIGWYTVLAAFGIFFTVLFIKGFIDADDVEVRLQPYALNAQTK